MVCSYPCAPVPSTVAGHDLELAFFRTPPHPGVKAAVDRRTCSFFSLPETLHQYPFCIFFVWGIEVAEAQGALPAWLASSVCTG